MKERYMHVRESDIQASYARWSAEDARDGGQYWWNYPVCGAPAGTSGRHIYTVAFLMMELVHLGGSSSVSSGKNPFSIRRHLPASPPFCISYEDKPSIGRHIIDMEHIDSSIM